jgi:aminoglycoside phosphotransferase (APT) family kinase protein
VNRFEESLAAVVVRRLAGCRGLVSSERLSGGASQETHRVVIRTGSGESALALRRAPGGEASRAEGRPGLETEALLLQRAREAGVPEPEVLLVLRAEDGLGEGFLMEWLDGETLGSRIVREPALDAVRPGLAERCGQILARIHSIDVEAAGLEGRLERVPPELYVRRTWERYQALGTPQPMIDFTARWLMEHLPTPRALTLVHNDFRNGNLMVSAAAGIVAVLDWELAHVGDPMRDLGWLCTNSWRFGRSELPVGGFGTREDLFRGYAAVSGEPVDPERVRFWEVFGSFWWSVACLGMAEQYRTGPDRSVERAAIGRRTSECQVDCVNLLIPGPLEPPEPEAAVSSLDLPRLDELVASVRDHLRDDVLPQTRGRTRFLARVAANSLEIALRELAAGGARHERELARLRRLLGGDGELLPLRQELARRLREGSLSLDAPGLADHLRQAAVAQVAIDQPTYSGLRTALANAERGLNP